MTAPNWQPGDVAMVECGDGEWRQAMCQRDLYSSGGDYVWRFSDGLLRRVDASDARLVVVIDPEDHDQTLRLAEAYIAANPAVAVMPAVIADRLANGLREFADPKPPEPQGLGAVVEDERGGLWVRDKTTTTVAHWKRAEGKDGGKRYPYAAVPAVRVLSEGVPA